QARAGQMGGSGFLRSSFRAYPDRRGDALEEGTYRRFRYPGLGQPALMDLKAVSPAMDPRIVFEQAIACHRQGDLAQAEQLYRTLLLANPGHDVVNHVMGLLHAQQERYAQALSHYEASLKTKPGAPGVLLDAGNAHEKLGQLDQALRCFE